MTGSESKSDMTLENEGQGQEINNVKMADMREARLVVVEEDAHTFKVYFKAFMALYGSIFFWYGTWTQFDVGFEQLGYSWASGIYNGTLAPNVCHVDLTGVGYTLTRDIRYIIIGTFVLILLDSLYANAAMSGHCIFSMKKLIRKLKLRR